MKCKVIWKNNVVTEYEIKEERENKSINLYCNNMLVLCLPAEGLMLRCVESNATQKLLYVCIYKNNKYTGLCGYVTNIKIENISL